ncbi:MAG: polysaccharide biosynthesis protein [Bacteroidales bacterium]|jgi:UDP-glucose 4-epimerase
MITSNDILLITGGTGSFGNVTLKRFLKTNFFKEIRIFSRDEKKQDDMRQHYQNEKIKYYIGDVRDKHSLDNAMDGVDYVFHAAALKQVPSCEFFPMEAVRTNVMGCENVLDCALENGVKNVVVLSTDKAVYPINAMGMSKALSEKVMVAKSRNLNGRGTVFCGTRYGNVMASRGSVIPLLVDQIKQGQPLTITDPKMTRFMMTLESAIDLVLFAFENGVNGDIFVQKAPASTVEVLAEALLKLYKVSNPIRIIGTRHGEKLYETLVNREEMVKAKDIGGYYQIPADNRDLNYGKYFTEGEEKIAGAEDYTSHNTRRLNIEQTMELLMKLEFIRKDIQVETAEND